MSEPHLVHVWDPKNNRDGIDQVYVAAGVTCSYSLVLGGKMDWQM